MTRPWWQFTLLDIVGIAITLTILYAVIGPPHGWLWLLVPPSALAGKYLGSATWRRGR